MLYFKNVESLVEKFNDAYGLIAAKYTAVGWENYRFVCK